MILLSMCVYSFPMIICVSFSFISWLEKGMRLFLRFVFYANDEIQMTYIYVGMLSAEVHFVRLEAKLLVSIYLSAL